MRAEYQFAPGLGLAIEGDAATVSHFDREYGSAATLEPTPVVVEVVFPGHGSAQSGGSVPGGHKSMRWRAELTAPDATVLGVRIEISGWPRAFARTLVQGYFVEPLLSVAAVRAGALLLPAAAFLNESGATVIMGRSGSGKTSLSMYALALGSAVLGDDQVLIDPEGACRTFPRRLRVYSDLGERVPLALHRMPRHIVAQLRVRKLVRILSRGAIAPPLPVPISIFGQRSPLHPAPIRRVVILERPVAKGGLRTETATVADAMSHAMRLLREQREHLSFVGGDSWREALIRLELKEEGLLMAAFESASIERVTAPSPLSGGSIAGFGAAIGLAAQPGP
jgi:hypothetical protein